MTTRTATYVGGPLDGQSVERRGNRWPMYRGDNGASVSVRDGDAEWVRRRQRGQGEARRYYILRNRNAAVTYLHASAWRTHAVDRS